MLGVLGLTEALAVHAHGLNPTVPLAEVGHRLVEVLAYGHRFVVGDALVGLHLDVDLVGEELHRGEAAVGALAIVEGVPAEVPNVAAAHDLRRLVLEVALCADRRLEVLFDEKFDATLALESIDLLS